MFSVVIPLYNKAPHIEATLRSVLSQHLVPDEIIVVDDGSTDGGDLLVSSFSEQGVRMIRQRNSGASAARNAGVAAASAAYVAFLDADDLWQPTHLASLRQAIIKVPQAGLFSTLHQIRVAARTFEPRSAFPMGFVGKVDDFFAAMAVSLSLVCSSTACVKRLSLLEIGGFPVGMHRGEDLIVWMKMAKAFGMAHSATVTAIYNRDAVNRSTDGCAAVAPGSLLYLRDIVASEALDVKDRHSAHLLFHRVAFYTAAGMKVSGDIQGMSAIRNLAANMKLWKLVAILMLLKLVPTSLLSFARRYRHPSATITSK